MHRFRRLLVVGRCLVAALAATGVATPIQTHAQVLPQHIQAGLAGLPGIGLQAGYVSPKSFYTIEGLLYVNTTPQFIGGEGNYHFSLGVGGALRPLGVLRTFGATTRSGYDLDLGLRFGPGLFFASNETRADKNKRFRPFLEPFIRFTRTPPGKRILFVELGTHRPFLRTGLWMIL